MTSLTLPDTPDHPDITINLCLTVGNQSMQCAQAVKVLIKNVSTNIPSIASLIYLQHANVIQVL